MIVAQEPTQSLAAPHRPLAAAVGVSGKQQDVVLPLVVPFGVEMIDIVAQRPPQGALAEQDHLRQALLLADLTQRSAYTRPPSPRQPRAPARSR